MGSSRMTLGAWMVFAAVAVASVGCGDGGSGGNGPAGTSSIGGNVSTAETTSRRSSERSALAWLAEEVLGFARKAYAQVTGVGDIEIEIVGEGGRSAGGTTDDGGNFDVPDAPVGNLNVHFRRDGCEATIPLLDVPGGARIVLVNVALACDSAQPESVTESFEGVVTHKPSSPNGNVQVCLAVGDVSRERTVKVKDASFETADGLEASFDDLAVGDQVAIEGAREGQGGSSAIDASVVTLLGPADENPCAPVSATPTEPALETPTPDGTGTPEATATVGLETPTAEPTTTATPEPTTTS